jgi:divalent metal cation (Fe/Co/Zn/Cd) transporter
VPSGAPVTTAISYRANPSWKRNTIASRYSAADARQTEFCTYLSAILLVGFLLNTLFGLWRADPVAALIMVPIIAKEGIEGL